MSKATKRKYVTKEVLDEYVLPEGDVHVAKVLAGRGNNLHEVEDRFGDTYLVSMPTKFRKNVWIKRGDYILIKPIKEGDKVKAEIVRILYKEQIKYIVENGLWPEAFSVGRKEGEERGMIPSELLPPSDSEEEDGEAGAEGSVINPNRRVCDYQGDSTDSSEEEVEEEQGGK